MYIFLQVFLSLKCVNPKSSVISIQPAIVRRTTFIFINVSLFLISWSPEEGQYNLFTTWYAQECQEDSNALYIVEGGFRRLVCQTAVNSIHTETQKYSTNPRQLLLWCLQQDLICCVVTQAFMWNFWRVKLYKFIWFHNRNVVSYLQIDYEVILL